MTLLAVDVERADDRRPCPAKDEPRHKRCQRLVHVDDVERRGVEELRDEARGQRIEAEA